MSRFEKAVLSYKQLTSVLGRNKSVGLQNGFADRLLVINWGQDNNNILYSVNRIFYKLRTIPLLLVGTFATFRSVL